MYHNGVPCTSVGHDVVDFGKPCMAKDVIDYIDAVKPFHTKLRNLFTQRDHLENVSVTVSEQQQNMNITFNLNDHSGPDWACDEVLQGGFDWDDSSQVAYKVEEEWQELKEEITPQQVDKSRVSEEIGDLLFSVSQLARHLDIDSEEALRKANYKFTKRFRAMEKLIADDGQNIHEMNQAQMDVYWDQAKRNEMESQR